jgi:L-rhamnose mutarotase
MNGEPVGHVRRVRAGMGPEYDRRHAEVWPELEDLLRRAGVRRYSIYRWGDVVFSHMEVDDYERLVAGYGDDPIAHRWEAEFADILEFPDADPVSGWPERLYEVWSLQ